MIHGLCKLLRPCFAVLLLAWAMTTSAANWLSVGKLGDNNQHAYDGSKLSFETDEVTYWRRIIFSTPVDRPQGQVSLGLYRERVNCRKHTLQLLDWLLYDAQNRVLERAANADGEWLPVVPDTIGDAFASKLCPMIPPQVVPQPIENTASAAVPNSTATKSVAPTKKPVVPVKPLVAPVIKESAASQPTATPGVPTLLGDDMIMIPGNGEKRVSP